MTVFALDTNIISYLLKKDPIVLKNFMLELSNGNECIIPPVSYYEIKRGLLLINSVVKAKAFDEICDEIEVGEMTPAVWNEAAKLYVSHRQSGKAIEDADIFIAAFCLVNGYTLVTNNTKHFKDTPNLKLVNWTE